MKEKKPKPQIVEFGLRKIEVYKDYNNNTITALEGGEEVYHGPSSGYHKWLRGEKRILAISRTKSI